MVLTETNGKARAAPSFLVQRGLAELIDGEFQRVHRIGPGEGASRKCVMKPQGIENTDRQVCRVRNETRP